MSHEIFVKQKRNIEAACGYQSHTYEGEVTEWKGNAAPLFTCLQVACDEVLGRNRIHVPKIRDLISAQPRLKNTMLLYEIIRSFIKELCSDDQQTQADECKRNYEEWKEEPGSKPFETLMTFIHIMEKHIEARKRLVGKEWTLQDYDSIEHFLKRVLPPLAKAIRLELARGKNMGLKVEHYTWEMVTEVVRGMRTAKLDPNKDFQLDRGKGALMALVHRGGEKALLRDELRDELRDRQGGVFSMANSEQKVPANQSMGGQTVQNWGAQRTPYWQSGRSAFGQPPNGAFRAGNRNTQVPGAGSGSYRRNCSCCGGQCKSAFACQMFELRIKFEDPRSQPGRIMERCELRKEHKETKRVPVFVQDSSKRFWNRETFLTGRTGQKLREAQLKNRLQEDFYSFYERLHAQQFGQGRGRKRDATGTGVFAVQEGENGEEFECVEGEGQVEVVKWELEEERERNAVVQEGNDLGRQEVNEVKQQDYKNPLDRFEFFGVIQEMDMDSMKVDEQDTEKLMATKENSPHQLALEYNCGTMIAKTAVDTGAFGCFMTVRRLEAIQKHNPGSLANCIKFSPTDPQATCLSASSNVMIKHGRVDHTVFMKDKNTQEPVLVTLTKDIITDCPLDELIGLQAMQAMESWLRMSMTSEKQVLQVTRPKKQEFELVRYSKGVKEGCMPMVEVGGDACMAVAVAAGEIAGVVEGNRHDVESQKGLEEIRVEMRKVEMRETWPVVGKPEQVQVTEIRCVKTGGNQGITPQCF
jgi:hypothetical protein